jgi:hypothetical protein
MRQLIKALLLFTILALAACTNDETDEGLELLTPNEPTESAKELSDKSLD